MAENNAGTAATQAQQTATPPTPASTAQPQTAPDGSQGADKAKLTAPLIKDPVEFLARARERLGYARKDADPAKPTSAQPSKQSGTASSANSADPAASPTSPRPAQNNNPSGAANTNSQSGQELTTIGSAKVPEPADDMAARVARLSREQREFEQQRRSYAEQQAKDKAEREKATQEHAAKLAQAETVEKAVKAIENGDVAGAIRMLKADVNPNAIALTLLEQLQKEDERTMSPAEVERMIAERLKSENEARAKAEEEARKAAEDKLKSEHLATLEGARESYMNACNGAFSKEKHPFIAAHGLSKETIFAYCESRLDERGRMMAPPDADELLNHFEEAYRKRAEAAGWAPKPKEAPKPAPSPSLSPSSLVQDQGGRLVAPSGPAKTLDQIRAERKQRIRIGGTMT